MAEQRERAPSDSLQRAASQMDLSAVATPAGRETEEVVETRVSSPGKDAWRRFSHNWAAMASLITIILLILMAIFAPLLHASAPMAQNYSLLDQAPSGHHWFGTDGLGRDYYSRILYGLRVPLLVGIIGAVVTVILGTLLGALSGFLGGIIDSLLSRFTDLMFAFPGFTLALIVMSLFGPALDPYFAGAGRLMMLILVFAVVGWPGLMRFVRSLALSMREQQFIEAARTSGTGTWGILRKHLMPNMYGVILVQASFIVVSFVYTEAVLSIFGLGVEPPNPDLGNMLYEGTQHLALNYWEAIIPSIFLTIIILAFTFLGDGVRDAVDPRSNG